ncbi:Protein of unknown function [Salinimicrobium sediminis]|uniref:DinB superfamily protein n=1 Tax=Salinimicrobium sediminis TaxID=1343891 RepID=A0A285X4J3_9FLAO|nr:DUF1569 domain-containing protein [Salinimicrobium sediminis]SOC80251.1 Protein of unknown function [Salinimicrobium sediminis]
MKEKVLEAQLEEMRGYIQHKAKLNTKVSSAPVGWHLAHNLKVIHSILDGLENSDPDQYRRSFSWKKQLVYLTGKIPRGKARAPKRVIPEDNISEGELREQINSAKTGVNCIVNQSEKSYFEHPFFGHIKRDETAKFLVIHTEHHLKIIRDILK